MNKTALRRKARFPQNGREWNSWIKNFLDHGDTSMFKPHNTGEIEEVEHVEIELPTFTPPAYEQGMNAKINALLAPQEIPAVSPDTDKTNMPTQLVQAIKPAEIIKVNWPERTKLKYDFIDYHFPGNPLMMLFGACIECNRTFDRLPDVLYVSRRMEPALVREAIAFYGAYDDVFRFYHPKALAGIKRVPIFPDISLPNELFAAFDGEFPIDCVIAVIEK